MKFFLDTANTDDIRKYAELGLVDGVTTNPTIVAREGRDFESVIKEITTIVDGPVSAEAGLKAVSVLSKEGIKTNVTLVFSVAQGLMAAKAGATFISPFVGRLDDIGSDGVKLIKDLRTVLDNYGLKSEIIAASIRGVQHVEAVALAGSDIATIPAGVFGKMFKHPLTDNGLASFEKDWAEFEASQK